MDTRTVVLGACTALIALLAGLTVTVLVRNGFDPLVFVSLIILALFGFGVLGALTNPPDE
jgi:uncharacterized ion transporter superfamily protein YfcC